MQRSLEARKRKAQDDPRPTHEFITTALTDPDEIVAWDAVSTLHLRGTREVFDAACQLCASDCPQERTLGANILAQLGIPDRSFPNESVKLLLSHLADEADEDVLDAICIALGHFHDPTAIRSIARLKAHPSANVRYAVVFSLLGFEDDLAIETLIELSRDHDEVVRDWATFGLGSAIDLDAPDIREALFVRVFDDDEVTRGEALVGLARRKDQRIIEPLIKELSRYPDAEHWSYSLEAAEAFADTRLLPVLSRLKQSADLDDTTLDEAIRRCSQVAVNQIDGSHRD